jgi:hypothetical protein
MQKVTRRQYVHLATQRALVCLSRACGWRVIIFAVVCEFQLEMTCHTRPQALKSEAASVDLLDKPMVGTGDSNGDGGGKSASRARNMSLSPRSGPKATPTQKELAEASALEKRFAKDFKLDDAGEEVARVKTLFQSACTRLKLLFKVL